MPADDEFPFLTCPDALAWDAWLREHHEAAPGIFLKIAKKGTGIATVTAKEAVPVALCWGWIDGQAKSIDDAWYRIRYTPRRARSNWSKVNVAYAEQLIADGRMQPAGLAQVDAAKADGRWDAAYSPVSARAVPPELQAALDAAPGAQALFDALGSQNRYAMTHRIETAKRQETKERNAAKFVAMLLRGETLH